MPRTKSSQQKQNTSITLGDVWRDYQISKSLKPNTVRCYQKVINRCLFDWLDKPISAITKDDVEECHRWLTRFGPAQANLAMRVLRALMNFAAWKYETADGASLISRNPVARLSEIKIWNRVARRQGFISKQQMPGWWQAVLSMQNATARDYCILLMLTGFRRSEAAMLKWDAVDFCNRCIVVADTKNGDRHVLPMSDVLEQMLLHRRQSADCEWVFPGDSNGHISRHNRTHEQLFEQIGTRFLLHDLRRTFINVAEDLELKDSTIKNLANHKSRDVTEGYKVKDPERLRKPMQTITNEILARAGIDKVSLPWQAPSNPKQARTVDLRAIDVPVDDRHVVSLTSSVSLFRHDQVTKCIPKIGTCTTTQLVISVASAQLIVNPGGI